MSSPSYPVFDPVTPKVSILAVGMKTIDSALELVKEAEQQAIKFLPQASLKANFMRMHYKEAATKCILRNGTGVRLELFEADSKGILPAYKPPTIMEPGEVASFLVTSGQFELKYGVQVFQGPFVGWALLPSKTVNLGPTPSQSTINAEVNVGGPKENFPTEILFVLEVTGELCEINVTQSIDAGGIGTYECHKYDGTKTKNDWHYVTIKAEGSQLRWSNRAGVSWMLTQRADGNLDVGKECPYYKNGHTVCQVVRNSAGSVTSLLGPWGEPYDAA